MAPPDVGVPASLSRVVSPGSSRRVEDILARGYRLWKGMTEPRRCVEVAAEMCATVPEPRVVTVRGELAHGTWQAGDINTHLLKPVSEDASWSGWRCWPLPLELPR